MHPTEFDNPATAYTPVQGDLFFSLPPILMLLILFFVFALVVTALWMSGAWPGGRDRRHDPCEAIYDAVRKAAEEALKASRDEVHAKARRLADVVERRLGGVLALSDGLGGPWRDIRAVLDPEAKADEPRNEACGGSGHGAGGVMVLNTGSMVVHAGAAPGKDGCDPHDEAPGPARPHHGAVAPAAKDHGGEPDRRDEVARLRAALHAFADHWRDKPRRLAELRRARADLC